MKQIFIGCFILMISLVAKAQMNPGVVLADQIAQKMKDSLLLSENQREQIYQLNLDLNNRKQLIWHQFYILDSVQIHLQRVENSRDSLYKSVLSDQQFFLYTKSKNNLIGSN